MEVLYFKHLLFPNDILIIFTLPLMELVEDIGVLHGVKHLHKSRLLRQTLHTGEQIDQELKMLQKYKWYNITIMVWGNM